ncbi:MAG: HemK2/MTQ2 family protein methyltransferase [Candidatus Micrarchaeota archaeon]
MELSHGKFRFQVPDSVYPPAEDSFMLADSAASLRGKILEVGCGSGIASIACAAADKGNEVVGVDINPDAVECAAQNAELNKIPNARFLVGDLFGPIEDERFDAIIFNPPYLPTADYERFEGDINRAYDGGKDGRETIDRFLSEFDSRLIPGGTLLLIQSSLNDLEKTKRALASIGYRISIEKEQSFFFEKLFLIKAAKPQV